jgi:hypothetical protein
MALLFYHNFVMELKTELSSGQILAALQIEPPDHDRFVDFARLYEKNPEAIPQKEATRFFFSLRSKYLRAFVDERLETGLSNNGSESPRQRELRSRVFLSLAGYLGTNPPRIWVSPVDAEVSMTIGNLPTGSARPSDPFKGAEIDALRYFSAIILGELKERLCKCRYSPCRIFFRLEKPRLGYRHGTFCSREHQRLASALSCTRESRGKAQRELIDFAAQELLRRRVSGPYWQHDVQAKRQLAFSLCSRIGRNPNCRVGVKTNWLTRNRISIEKRRLEISSERGAV